MVVKMMKLVPPDGGWGWAVLFGAVVINMLLPGTVKSFGVLFVEFIKVFKITNTEASWIPALCYFFYNSLGPLSSILASKYSYRTVAIIGCVISSSGLMLTYLADSVLFLYISYGVMMGAGCGLSFPVTIYIVSEYFERLRGFATGLCICGSCIGTIVLPPLLQLMLNHLGHKLTVLILGVIILGTVVCALTFQPVERHMKLIAVDDADNKATPKSLSDKLKDKTSSEEATSHRGSIATIESLSVDPRRVSLSRQLTRNSLKPQSRQDQQPTATEEYSEDEARRSFFDLSILKDPAYLVILVSNSAAGISNTNFMILLPAYAVAEGHGNESAALLLSVVSMLDLIGRVGGATLSDVNFVPKHYYFVAGLLLSGLALTLVPLSSDYVYLATLVGVFGLASGLYIGTTAVVMADLLGPERLVSSYGIWLFINSLTQLAGPPVCNATFERIGTYRPIFLALGMIPICGTALWGLLPFIKRTNAETTTVVKKNAA